MKKSENQAYAEIFNVLEKYKDLYVFDIDDMKRRSDCHLFGVELKEVYGLNINPKDIQTLDWIRLNSHITIGKFGKKHNRSVSWSDDGRQPKDDILMLISFPTGAYIFGDDYPTELFQNLFNELKSYNPDYLDTTNKCLYFALKNAGKVFNDFDSIMKKYYELNKDDAKQRRIKKLKEDLKQLES